MSPTSMMSRASINPDSRRAFTLLELLLVLMLIAISAAAVVPNLNGTLGCWQLRETARNLQTALQGASQWSRVRQETVVFAVDVRRGSFDLRAPRGSQSDARGLLSVGRQSFGQGIEISRMEGFKDVGKEKILVFGPDGTSRAATIVLTGAGAGANHQTQWEITADGFGAVQCRERPVDETGK